MKNGSYVGGKAKFWEGGCPPPASPWLRPCFVETRISYRLQTFFRAQSLLCVGGTVIYCLTALCIFVFEKDRD